MRILHFVTGGFSGATRVAADLVRLHNQTSDMECVLVLRRKKSSTPEKLQILADMGIPYFLVSGSLHFATIWQLTRLCRQWKPDILVTHGFPEHILGRWGGVLAKVPNLVQVEHNSVERYTFWKTIQSRFLSRYTATAIGVSQGVAEVLRKQKLHTKIIAIANGIDTERYVQAACMPVAQRPKDIVMVGRFAKSKDQATVIRAVNRLRTSGIIASLTFVGSGSKRHRQHAQKLVKQLQLEQQVTFIEHSNNVPDILAEHKIFVMASFFEGLNLSVIEAMAAACVVVGSDTVGVAELIDHDKSGFLFPQCNDKDLSKILRNILSQPSDCQHLADAARQLALSRYSKQQFADNYRAVFRSLNSR